MKPQRIRSLAVKDLKRVVREPANLFMAILFTEQPVLTRGMVRRRKKKTGARRFGVCPMVETGLCRSICSVSGRGP